MSIDENTTTKLSPEKSNKFILFFLVSIAPTFFIMMMGCVLASDMVIPSHLCTLYGLSCFLGVIAYMILLYYINKRYWLLLLSYVLFLLLINAPIFLNFKSIEKDTYTEYAFIKDYKGRTCHTLLLEFSNGEGDISPDAFDLYNYHRGEYVKVELRNGFLFPIIVDYDIVSVKKEFLEKHQ